MNANELADWLENEYEEVFPNQQDIVDMLRQQQAEIEKLKAEIVAIEKNTDYWADKANWIKNNEPVAYVSTTGLNDIEWTDKSHLLNYGDALYLYPVKELTDEEIMEVANDTGWSGYTFGLNTFAKAILRKAQG